MTWYEKALKNNRQEIISGTIFAVTSALALLIWHYTFGATFTWDSISPISAPWEYAFYSALVYLGPGAYLFNHTSFYKDLWRTFRKNMKAYHLHKAIKKIIWYSMAAIMLIIVIVAVYLLNTVISFFYNIIRLILFLNFPLGFGLVAFLVSYLLMKKDSIT